MEGGSRIHKLKETLKEIDGIEEMIQTKEGMFHVHSCWPTL